MKFNYFLHKLNTNNLTYNYLIKIYNENLIFEINLNNYPNYIFLNNNNLNNNNYYKIIKIINIKNKIMEYNLGDVELINTENYITNNNNNIIKNNIHYRKCNQMELDKYFYLNNIQNDNSKLFKYIYYKIILFYKKEYINKIQKEKNKIKVFTVNNKIYKESII
tara:strand:- start:25 stop:516 length:492 start_codon:yes stop_codon:yes gene_type:complete